MNEKTIVCGYCGTENPVENALCSACGGPLKKRTARKPKQEVPQPVEPVSSDSAEPEVVEESKPTGCSIEGFGIFLFIILIGWCGWLSLIQPKIDEAKYEKERQAEEAQYAQEVADHSPYCYELFNALYAPYLDGGTVSFNIPCYREDDLWDFSGYSNDGSYAYYRFNGSYSEAFHLFLVTIDQGSHLMLMSDNPVKQIDSKDGEDRYLVFGNSFTFEYEAGFEPTPEPEESYIWVDVPNERYNSAGCIAYRMLGGSSGLGGENPNNPNYDPECAYPTHQEKKYIENP